jgi:hypothetical protein
MPAGGQKLSIPAVYEIALSTYDTKLYSRPAAEELSVLINVSSWQ